MRMKLLIHYDKEDWHDSLIVEAGTIEECRAIVNQECQVKRHWPIDNCWSELLEKGEG